MIRLIVREVVRALVKSWRISSHLALLVFIHLHCQIKIEIVLLLGRLEQMHASCDTFEGSGWLERNALLVTLIHRSTRLLLLFYSNGATTTT